MTAILTAFWVMTKGIILFALPFIKKAFLYGFAFLMICIGSCGTPYDAEKPDTEANRKGFKLLFGFPPGPGVRDLYFYADEFCLKDPLYCASFTAEEAVVERIIRERNMLRWYDPTDAGPDTLPWWNAKEREKSLQYVHKSERERTLYSLWHDPETGKCQFMKFCY